MVADREWWRADSEGCGTAGGAQTASGAGRRVCWDGEG
jgi:hypothetical protein